MACASGAADDGERAQTSATPPRTVPRPDLAVASFHFPGDMPNQREFVWLYPDASYDYAERWDVGLPDEPDQVDLGWDWKVGCRLAVRPLADGTPCCAQSCSGGGDSGVGREPPEAFGCMNRTAGGRFDWFLEGLASHGVGELDRCFASTEPAPPDDKGAPR